MSLLTTATLVVTPNANKTSKLYSVIPSNGNGDFTVTRATTATRTNSAGLIEVVPYNLLTWSEMFSDASWVKNNSSITANTTTAPDGTLTADTLTELATTAFHAINQSLTLNANKYTFSFYAKPNGRNFIQWNNSVVSDYVNFNIATGAIGSSQNVTNATTENVGNGWYKCSFEYTATSATGTWYRLTLITSATSARLENYLGDGTSGAFIWGAQINEGTPLTYLRTETRLNIPRLDYSLGSCPNLLLEPQRTNLATFSEQFDNASWTKDAGVIVNANTTTSPSGVQDADQINFTINNRAIYRAGTSTGAHMFSIYLKGEGANIGKQIQLIIGNVGGTTNVTLTDQWQRFTADATSSSYVGITKVSSGQADSVLAWGAQLEAGAYATSYIPTTTASVTRNADSISLGNVYTNGLISASGGTWFVELRNNIPLTRDANTAGLNLDTILGTNGFALRNNATSTRLTISKYIASARTDLYVTTTNTCKIAIKWNGTTADIFENGTKVVSATAFTTTAMQLINGTSADVSKNINQMALWATPLTDTQLTQLTTL